MCFPTVALGFHLVALFEAVQQKLTNRWAVRDLSFAHLIARPSAPILFRFESKERIGRWHVNSYSSLQAKMSPPRLVAVPLPTAVGPLAVPACKITPTSSSSDNSGRGKSGDCSCR
jgi:hypothetical protein